MTLNTLKCNHLMPLSFKGLMSYSTESSVQSLDWCKKPVFSTNHLAGTSRPNLTAIKWHQKPQTY